MTRLLFIYADGRREFHHADPKRPVWQVADRPPMAGMTLSEFMAAPDVAVTVTVRTFHRVERYMTEDCHGPVLGGVWWIDHRGPSWDRQAVRRSVTWHER